MDNFVIGTIQENIKTLQSDLNRISSDIPTKFKDLTDVSGKWTIDSNGDIIPENDNTVSLGSASQRIKSIYVSDGSIYIIKKTQANLVTVKFQLDENNDLKITKETYNSVTDLNINNPSTTGPGISLSGGAQNINDLTDVSITDDSEKIFLKRGEAGTWVNSLLTTGDITDFPFITTTTDKVTIGLSSVDLTDTSCAVAIGNYAGHSLQNPDAIAIGFNAGNNSQGNSAVAIGRLAGFSRQQTEAIAIGSSAGYSGQGEGAVAIGSLAGQSDQGDYSIAIGHLASRSNTDQVDRYIVLNAQDDELNPKESNAFYVKPIRLYSNTNKLLYNPDTGEITYQPDDEGVPAPPTTLLDSNIESFDFTKATISGTDVEIDGNIVGTTFGTGVVEVSEENGISTTTDSYVDLNMRDEFAWTSDFTLEFYFMMHAADGTQQNNNKLFYSFNLDDEVDRLFVGRKSNTNGIQFYTSGANVQHYNLLQTESSVAGFDGNWGHIVLTHDSSQPMESQKQLYVNGVRFTDGVQFQGNIVDFTTGHRDKYRVGRDNEGDDNGVENLKLFRVYSGILSDEEVATLYDRVSVSGITNYHLVSNNATGTETKWVKFPHITTTDTQVRIGFDAGTDKQGTNTIAIGRNAGTTLQKSDSVAIGYHAGFSGAGTNSISIGSYAGDSNVNNHNNYIILNATGFSNVPSKSNSFYVKPIQEAVNNHKLLYDPDTGEITYQPDAAASLDDLTNVIISQDTDKNFLKYNGNNWVNSTLARGDITDFPNITTTADKVTIGLLSISPYLTTCAVAIGNYAGFSGQQVDAIAIGYEAGQKGQNQYSVAIGSKAGWDSQSINAVAIGYEAGKTDQGEYSIAIGHLASLNNTTNNVDRYIVLNAQTTELNPEESDAFYVKPIRQDTNANKLLYNSDTGEITYQQDVEGVPLISLNDLTDVTLTGRALVAGDVLKYTSAISGGGHGWVSSTITSADIADFYPEVDARIAAGGGVPAPVYSIISPTLPTTLSGSIIIDIDFTKATISGTYVEIDGITVGTTFGTGVQVSEGGGISTTIDSYVNLNSFAWTENFTIEFYCNMPAYSGTQSGNSLFASFDTVSGGQEADRLSIGRAGTSNGINFTTTNADAIFSSIHVTNASVPGFNGTWGHIVLTHDSSQMPGAQKQLYVNGVRFTDVSDFALSNVPVTYTAGTRNNYWVGRRYDNTDNGVENLKIFRVYNRILTDAEVATLYQSYAVTNYQLVSNNATGTETKWVQFPHITTTTDKVAIGLSSGTTSQSSGAVAIGAYAANVGQGTGSVAIGSYAGNTSQGIRSIAIGSGAATTSQGQSSVALGDGAGRTGQGANSIAIGKSSGSNSQGISSVAIGLSSGTTSQGESSVAIGYNVGNNGQGDNSVAIGTRTGNVDQGNHAVAIGTYAAEINQGSESVALGWHAGRTSQDQRAIAIGRYAGYSNQGAYSIAIGEQASMQNIGNFKNYIILNAKYEENAATNALNPSHSNAFYVKPIRPDTNANKLLYNSDTGEITYQQDVEGVPTGGVPAPLSLPPPEPTLLAGTIESIDFTEATIPEGTNNVEINGNIIGFTYGNGVQVNEEGGISTTEESYVDLTGFDWTSQFTLEFYFKMPSGSDDPQNYNALFSSFDGPGEGNFQDYVVVERREGGDGIHFYTTNYDGSVYNTIYTNVSIAGFDGNWGHIVLTNDSNETTANLQKKLYVNGQRFTNVNFGGGAVDFATGARDNYWVGRNAYGTFYENGVENLKIFRVYNRILSDTEVETLYNNINGTSSGTSDVTNYHLVSNNATGTETKWVVSPHITTSEDKVAIGHSAIAQGNGSIVIGSGAQNAIVGQEDVDNSIVIGWNARGNGKDTITLGDSLHTLYLPGYHINFPVGDPNVQPGYSFNIKAFNDGDYNNQTRGRLELGFVSPPNDFTPVLTIMSAINSMDPVYVYTSFPLYAQVFRTTSDDRIKSNEKPITQGVSVIEQLQPKIYDKHQNHRVPADKEDNDLTGVDYVTESGFVAQDVDKIEELKHLVQYNDLHDIYSLNYTGIIPYLVQSIKELNARIKVLESK